jgi:hypothetical protein
MSFAMHKARSLRFVPMPRVRYNEMWLRETWRTPHQLQLTLHLR